MDFSFMSGLVPADTSPKLLRALRVVNVPPNTTPTEILNLVNTGMVESLEMGRGSAVLRLMNYTSAFHLFVQWHLKPPFIGSTRLKFEWQPVDPVPSEIAQAVAAGASRNVYIADLPENETVESLAAYSTHGPIESIRIKGKVAFIHYLSIRSAISARNALTKWSAAYGHDRCSHITKHQKHLISLYLGQPPTGDHATLTITLAQMATAAMAISSSVATVGNRTLYLSQLDPSTTLEQVCLVAARGGMVQNVRLIAATKAALVTFIDPIAAAQFYATWNVCPLQIGESSQVVRVEYAKATPASLNRSLASLDDNVTRNVYLGSLPANFNRGAFTRAMHDAGSVARIHWVPESHCAFVNFADMDEARRAYRFLRTNPLYRDLPTRFAKDRVGGPTRREKLYRGPFMLQYLSRTNVYGKVGGN